MHYSVFGGPHNQALRLAVPLAVRGFETVVVVPDEPGNAAERLRTAGVDVRVMHLHRIRAVVDPRVHFRQIAGLASDIQRLRRLIREDGIGIVQVGGLVNPQAAIAARLEHVPVVWQLLDTRAPWPVAVASMVWVRALADVVMSTGLAVAEAHPLYRSIADRVVPFFPPVDLDRFVPYPGLRGEVRATWGIPENALVVGCVANINPQKGIVDLIAAFAGARRGRGDTRLVLVGAEHATHAKYSAAVRARMAAEGLVEGTDVVFAGGRDDVERQLAGMDVLALAAAARSEGITTSVLEGMAASLPVVVTDVGALREAVRDGIAGFLVAGGRTADFASALGRLLDDGGLRLMMGREGRRAAEAQFGLDRCAETHVRAYQSALARWGRESPRSSETWVG